MKLEGLIWVGLCINILWFVRATYFESRVLDMWRENLRYSRLHWENRELHLSAIEAFDKGYAQGKKDAEDKGR